MNREVASSVAKNTTVMLGSQLITGVLSAILMLFLPRYLGTVDYGRLYLAISIQAIFQMLMVFGGRFYIVKEIARNTEAAPNLVANSLGIRLIFWVVSMVAMIAFSFIVGYPTIVRWLVLILGLSMLWEGMRLVLWCCFTGFEALKYPSLGAVAERLFVTTLSLLVLILGGNSLFIATIMMFGTLLNFILCFAALRTVIPPLPKIDWHAGRDILRKEFPYFLLSIFGVIYFRIDAVMLSLMTPAAVVGWYGAAYRFFDVLMFLPSIFNIAVFPVLSKLWIREGDQIARATQKSINLMIICGIPLAMLVFVFAEEIIQLFFGLQGYRPSIHLLKIFSVGLVLMYINFALGATVFASDRYRKWSFVAFFAILLNVVANYFLIPLTQSKFGDGGIGSAIATIVTEFYIMCAALVFIRGRVFKGSSVLVPIKGVLAGGGMALTLWMSAQGSLPWPASSGLALLTYFLLLLVLRVFEPAELDFARSFLTLSNLKSVLIPHKGSNV